MECGRERRMKRMDGRWMRKMNEKDGWRVNEEDR